MGGCSRSDSRGSDAPRRGPSDAKGGVNGHSLSAAGSEIEERNGIRNALSEFAFLDSNARLGRISIARCKTILHLRIIRRDPRVSVKPEPRPWMINFEGSEVHDEHRDNHAWISPSFGIWL